MQDLSARLDLLAASDRFKTRPSGLTLCDGSRRETAGEGWWHDALWALAHAETVADWGADPAGVQAALLAGEVPCDLPEPALTDRAAAARIRSARRVFQPLFTLGLAPPERDALRAALTTGEAAFLADDWPEAHGHAMALLERQPPASSPEFRARLAFVMEADLLKSGTRATPLIDNSRKERTGEHCWQVALAALVMRDAAVQPVRLAEAVAMLLIHDLVEIDAGDAPIHGSHDAEALALAEEKAARRIFGLLPEVQGTALRRLWEVFEAAETAEALYAKALDRALPVLINLESGGGSWRDYEVTRAQLETRVAGKVRAGAPGVWEAMRPRIDAWFSENAV